MVKNSIDTVLNNATRSRNNIAAKAKTAKKSKQIALTTSRFAETTVSEFTRPRSMQLTNIPWTDGENQFLRLHQQLSRPELTSALNKRYKNDRTLDAVASQVKRLRADMRYEIPTLTFSIAGVTFTRFPAAEEITQVMRTNAFEFADVE